MATTLVFVFKQSPRKLSYSTVRASGRLVAHSGSSLLLSTPKLSEFPLQYPLHLLPIPHRCVLTVFRAARRWKEIPEKLKCEGGENVNIIYRSNVREKK